MAQRSSGALASDACHVERLKAWASAVRIATDFRAQSVHPIGLDRVGRTLNLFFAAIIFDSIVGY